MTIKDFAEVGSTAVVAFLAVFQVVRLDKTLRSLERTLARLCGLVKVDPDLK